MDVTIQDCEEGEYISDEYDYYGQTNTATASKVVTASSSRAVDELNNNNADHCHSADAHTDPLTDFLYSNNNTSDQNTSIDASVIDLLAAEAAVVEGPAITNSVAKLINNHLSRDFRRSAPSTDMSGNNNNSATARVLEKVNNTLIPENTPNLKSCRVNEGMFKAMPAIARKYNGELRLTESALCRAVVCQGQAMEKLLNLKSLAANSLGSAFDDVFKDIATAIEFNVCSRAKVNNVRREVILDNVNDNYKHLSRTTVPSGGLLFGEDLDNAMKSVESSNRLSLKLSDRLGKQTNANYRPFLGQRGRFRGRPRSSYHHHPYSQQGRNLPPHRGRQHR